MWFVSFFWFNQINQINQKNQIDQNVARITKGKVMPTKEELLAKA